MTQSCVLFDGNVGRKLQTLLFGRDLFLIPSMAIIIAVLIIMRRKIEAAGGGDHD